VDNILFFDTETTGLPKGGHDPRIIQLAALLCSSDGLEIAQLNLITIPSGAWVMQPDAQAVHGKSEAFVRSRGIPIRMALDRFHAMVDQVGTVVAHNLPFDYQRYVRELDGGPDHILPKNRVCTMQAATPICQLPPTEKMIKWGRGNQHKSPNLTEAHQFFYVHGFDGAHDALADVRACRDVYFALKERGAL